MRIVLVIFAVVLTAQGILAAFDPSLFPMYLHPSKTDEVESNVVSEISMRQISVGVASNSLVKSSWWRSRSGNLQQIKTALKAQLISGSWVCWNEIGGAVGSSLNASNVVPCYTATNYMDALTRWGLPTNYLDKTFWSDLSGVGGWDYDIASVGHPHGTTNSTTVAGGPLPSGRTSWYTTDYGWDGVWIIATNLVAVRYDYWQNNANYNNPAWAYEISLVWDSPTNLHYRSYAETIAACNASIYHMFNGYFQGIGQFTLVSVGSSNVSFFCQEMTHPGTLDAATAIPSNSLSWMTSTAFYLHLSATNNAPGPGGAQAIFDGQSYGWSNGWNEISATILSNGRPYYVFGETTVPPNWPSFPATNTACVMGWSVDINTMGHVVVKYSY